MVEIHDGPYNNIKNWDYAGLILAFNAEDGRGRGLRATSGRELEEAIKVAVARKGLSRDHHREMTVMDAVKNVLGLNK